MCASAYNTSNSVIATINIITNINVTATINYNAIIIIIAIINVNTNIGVNVNSNNVDIIINCNNDVVIIINHNNCANNTVTSIINMITIKININSTNSNNFQGLWSPAPAA